MISKIPLVIVEDDRKAREGLSLYFGAQPEMNLQGSYDTVENLLEYHHERPGVVLLDINLPGISGIKGIQLIKSKWNGASVVMLTNFDDADRVFQSLKAGANGYLLKSTPLAKIKEGILDIEANGAPMSPVIAKKVIDYFNPGFKSENPKPGQLTPREKEVVDGLVKGLSYDQIAQHLQVSLETVRHHIKNIYSKLQVNSKVEVVAKSLRGEI